MADALTRAQRGHRRERIRAGKELERTINKRTLEALRAKVRKANLRKRWAIGQTINKCRIERARVAAEIKELRARERARINRITKEMRQEARNRCQLRKVKIRQSAKNAAERARLELIEQRRLQAEIRAVDRRIRKEAKRRVTGAERRAESDDQVRQNIPPEMVPVFDKIRRTIKAKPGMSRTEAFLHYVEENPGEVYAVQYADEDRELQKMIAEHQKEELEQHREIEAAKKREADREAARKAKATKELERIVKGRKRRKLASSLIENQIQLRERADELERLSKITGTHKAEARDARRVLERFVSLIPVDANRWKSVGPRRLERIAAGKADWPDDKAPKAKQPDEVSTTAKGTRILKRFEAGGLVFRKVGKGYEVGRMTPLGLENVGAIYNVRGVWSPGPGTTLFAPALEAARKKLKAFEPREPRTVKQMPAREKAAGLLGAKLNELERQGWRAVAIHSTQITPKLERFSDLPSVGILTGGKVQQMIRAGVELVPRTKAAKARAKGDAPKGATAPYRDTPEHRRELEVMKGKARELPRLARKTTAEAFGKRKRFEAELEEWERKRGINVRGMVERERAKKPAKKPARKLTAAELRDPHLTGETPF
jgi:hypothetical protein